MIWYDMIWYDMIWYEIIYDMIYNMIWKNGSWEDDFIMRQIQKRGVKKSVFFYIYFYVNYKPDNILKLRMKISIMHKFSNLEQFKYFFEA